MIALPPGAEKWTAAERELAIAVLSGDTQVVNVRKGGPHKRLVPWLVDEGLLTYVGHSGPRHDWLGSPYANPFVGLRDSGRTTMVEKYREWLHQRPDTAGRGQS